MTKKMSISVLHIFAPWEIQASLNLLFGWYVERIFIYLHTPEVENNDILYFHWTMALHYHYNMVTFEKNRVDSSVDLYECHKLQWLVCHAHDFCLFQGGSYAWLQLPNNTVVNPAFWARTPHLQRFVYLYFWKEKVSNALWICNLSICLWFKRYPWYFKIFEKFG